jgi:hypothetical protein
MANPLFLSRVLAKCTLDPVTGCWLWNGGHNGDRYGRQRDESGRLSSNHL